MNKLNKIFARFIFSSITALKIDKKYSFTSRKLRFLIYFCLVLKKNLFRANISNIYLLIFFISSPVAADNMPTFNLLADAHQLPAATQVTIKNDPVYNSEKIYQAYPLIDIIKKLVQKSTTPLKNQVIVFTAADGYKVTMNYQDALLQKGYIAFKDIAAKKDSWIPFKFGQEQITPAPYYLVWPNPSLDKWRYPSPFQLTRLTLQNTADYFSKASPISTKPTVTEGFNLFSRYCIRCHSINHTGGKLGPELNTPVNITDTFSSKTLTAFILDAPSYRANTKMPAFKNTLQKQQVLKIQHYLKSMKNAKIK